MEVDTKKVFYDKLTYIYVEIPKFDKTEDQLVTMYDKWMFVLKNLSVLMERPAALQERVFTRLFEQAEVSKFNAQDRMLYEDSVNAYRDIINAINSTNRTGKPITAAALNNILKSEKKTIPIETTQATAKAIVQTLKRKNIAAIMVEV